MTLVLRTKTLHSWLDYLRNIRRDPPDQAPDVVTDGNVMPVMLHAGARLSVLPGGILRGSGK